MVPHQHWAVTWTLTAAFGWAVLYAMLRFNVVSPTALTIVVVIAVPLIAFAIAGPRDRA